MTRNRRLVLDKSKVQKTKNKRLVLDKSKIQNFKNKIAILKHLTKKNCVLLQYLDEQSLHTIGEFIFNVITQRLELTKNQERKVKNILNKNKSFYLELINKENRNPLAYLRANLKKEPQVGQGLVGILAALSPLISSLFMR